MPLLVRHAWAGDSALWVGDDRARPLDEDGVKRAAELVELMRERGVTRVLTSPYLRCVQTVEPLARALNLPLEYRHELGDDSTVAEALPLLRELSREPAVFCVHGELVEQLLGEELAKGEVAAVEVTGDGVVVRERF
jgi:8-oxo-dGTP diphosphatase